MTALHSIPLTLIDGAGTDFGRFKGEVVLVVNIASQCGFTPHYAGLEVLHNEFREQGFTVLGVPCNQFAGQEPAADTEIAEFCERNFGVTFPLTTEAASGRRGKTVDRLAALARTEREGIRPAQQRGAYKGQKKALTPEQAAQLVQGAEPAESGYWPSWQRPL